MGGKTDQGPSAAVWASSWPGRVDAGQQEVDAESGRETPVSLGRDSEGLAPQKDLG